MNFILQPSLERSALVQVAAVLWNQSDIKTLIVEFLNSNLSSRLELEITLIRPSALAKKVKWQNIENKVMNKMPQLTVPESLKGKVQHFIKIVGFQILRWLEYHRLFCSLDLSLPNEFYWTSHGVIDKKKMAEVLVNDESISIMTRYKLACIYCLEEDILKLWNKMPECQRECLYDREDPTNILEPFLVVLWTYVIKEEMFKIENMVMIKYDMPSVYGYSFQYAANSGNKAATEYFLQKITPRHEFLMETTCYIAKCYIPKFYNDHYRKLQFPKEYCSEVFCFLISQMREEKREELFQRNAQVQYYLLKCLLDWPFQCFYVQIATHLWHFITQRRLIEADNVVLRMILQKVVHGYKDFDYKKMFGELWQQISIDDRSSVLNGDSISDLIEMLLFLKDAENMRLILDDATEEEKKMIIHGKFFTADLVLDASLDMLKLCLKICISTKDDMVNFKQEFEQYISTYIKCHGTCYIKKEKCDSIFQLLDDLISGYDKRKLEDESNTNNPSKKICILKFEGNCIKIFY